MTQFLSTVRRTNAVGNLFFFFFNCRAEDPRGRPHHLDRWVKRGRVPQTRLRGHNCVLHHQDNCKVPPLAEAGGHRPGQFTGEEELFTLTNSL